MTNERMNIVADFLYSSNNAKKVPLRIAIESGMSGASLNKDNLIELLKILSNSINLKKDLIKFLDRVY